MYQKLILVRYWRFQREYTTFAAFRRLGIYTRSVLTVANTHKHCGTERNLYTSRILLGRA